MLYELSAPQEGRSVIRAAVSDRVELRDLATLDVPSLGLLPDNGVGPLSADDVRPEVEPDDEVGEPLWADEEAW